MKMSFLREAFNDLDKIPAGILTEASLLYEEESSEEGTDTSSPILGSDSESEDSIFVTPYTPTRKYSKILAPGPAPRCHHVSPVRAHLIANQLLKYDNEPDFQDFMVRFHCLPYATDFKFEVNAYINEYYALKSERSVQSALRNHVLANTTDPITRLSDQMSRLLTINEEEE